MKIKKIMKESTTIEGGQSKVQEDLKTPIQEIQPPQEPEPDKIEFEFKEDPDAENYLNSISEKREESRPPLAATNKAAATTIVYLYEVALSGICKAINGDYQFALSEEEREYLVENLIQAYPTVGISAKTTLWLSIGTITVANVSAAYIDKKRKQ